MKKFKIYIFLIAIMLFACNENTKKIDNPIEKFQSDLIAEGTTGSNVAKVFKNGEVIYDQVVNSGASGDKDIDSNTIFPIWSMSKTVTTVGMMILLDRGLYNLDDNVSDYLPEYYNLNCKGDDGIYPCEKKLKITHLLSHRSGFTYYAKNGSNWIASLTTDLYPAVADPVRFNNLDDFSKAAAKIPLDFEPGEMYTYGINQAILGRLIEVISGQSFYSFL